MRIIAGVILLVIGVAFPMGTLLWLNTRMKRQQILASRQVGMILAFNGVLPVSLVTLGLGLISARLWAILAFRIVTVSSSLVAILLLVGLGWISKRNPPSGGKNDR